MSSMFAQGTPPPFASIPNEALSYLTQHQSIEYRLATAQNRTTVYIPTNLTRLPTVHFQTLLSTLATASPDLAGNRSPTPSIEAAS
jgi:hypothetical protein